jgi:hypothetical protein
VSSVQVLGAILLCGGPVAAFASGPDAVGVEVDLLPTVVSAIDGAPGGSVQLWARWGNDRVRLVGAHLDYPNALTAAPFEDHQNTTVALIYDRFLQVDGRGPWIGAGVEYWWSSIGLRENSDRGYWQGPVATVGAGWIFPVWRGLYLNPWGAVHVPLTSGSVEVGTERYEPKAIEAEVSLKVGWSFPARW